MSEVFEGVTGGLEIIRRMEDPEEFEPGHLIDLRHILTALGREAVEVGRVVLFIQKDLETIHNFLDLGAHGTAAGYANASLVIARDNLRRIQEAMMGKVRLELGNLDDSSTLAEVNARRGHE